MTVNMGKADRSIRLVVAAVLLVAAFTSEVASSGALHWLAIAVAAVFALTALVGNCPLYSLVGIRTCRVS
ncbi:DUF2892 domain-containing protein [Stappia sp. F7233]|uniref:DUF2892 domain-containing protein n=1 Tax=Stappia albiluteola TaxID=2758565 RepID=A0A839AKX1_9HYPH|nr:DUF2892 domain-containing protein [Stappia albiluteola]MBA5779447.1 DUF2892 domain-containing protein [Stappia albiluteola]